MSFRTLRGFVVLAMGTAALVPNLSHAETQGDNGSPVQAALFTGAFKPVHHDRIFVHRDDNGGVRITPRNTVETSNWSGYSLENFATGQTYETASATWIVPAVTYQAPAQTCHVMQGRHGAQRLCFSQATEGEYSSTWVGIGGTCEDSNCARTDNTLIQLGTEQDVAADGSTEFYAWYEMLPNAAVVMEQASSTSCRHSNCGTPYPVKPGDSITASLTCMTNCQPGQSQTWKLSLTDATQNWTFTKTVTYRSTLASVEWIEEAPSSNAGVLPLADFKTISLTPMTDDGTPLIPNATNGGPGADAITMVDPYGETAEPSPVGTHDLFSACWGNSAKSIAPCPID